MKNMKLSTKLIGGFLAVSLIGALIGGWGLLKINQVARSEMRLYEQMTVPLGKRGIAIFFFRSFRLLQTSISGRKTVMPFCAILAFALFMSAFCRNGIPGHSIINHP